MVSLVASSAFSYPKSSSRENQDSILSPRKFLDGFIFAVADGIGSYQGAKEASTLVISCLEQWPEDEIEFDVNLVFEKLKFKIKELSQSSENFSSAATTLTFCFINSAGLHIGHIGDCRLYIKNGMKLKKVTKDHTQHQKLIDDKVFSAKELKGKPGKNILVTAISSITPMVWDSIFIPHSELYEDDEQVSIYIMSDGAHHFWEERPRFSIKTMSSMVRFSSSLLNRIERKGSIDDYSLVSANISLK